MTGGGFILEDVRYWVWSGCMGVGGGVAPGPPPREPSDPFVRVRFNGFGVRPPSRSLHTPLVVLHTPEVAFWPSWR